ncbi:MAG: DUF2797 domain-containing protein [Verrucomicrobiales bacterium]|nr:DUF2797 domain-containing protein [Verrucomicrobiales bacterium]
MKYEGNIRKMKTSLLQDGGVEYRLPLYDVLESGCELEMNALIGQTIRIEFQHQINCVVSGKRINKAFGDGMSYDAFMNSPMAVPSIIRPELSRIHEGIALRDEEWEREHHLKPHVVYLSKTGGVKVGVTRDVQIPARWIDQGATEAILLAEVPYRQLAGLIEVEMKDHMSDRTNWRNMLKNVHCEVDLLEAKDEALELLPEEYHEFISDNDEITQITYPVLAYPEKVVSMKLDKIPLIEKKLMGIKGQYLIFEDNSVMNLRSHSGYRVVIEG